MYECITCFQCFRPEGYLTIARGRFVSGRICNSKNDNDIVCRSCNIADFGLRNKNKEFHVCLSQVYLSFHAAKFSSTVSLGCGLDQLNLLLLIYVYMSVCRSQYKQERTTFHRGAIFRMNSNEIFHRRNV